MGNKMIQHWSWLYTQNPPPTRLHLNVWCGIYFHLRFSGTPWLLIHGSIWNGGLGEDTGKCRENVARLSVCAWFGRLLQPFKTPGRYFRIESEWVSERTSCGCDTKPSQWTYCLYFFGTLNKMQVLYIFHVSNACLLQNMIPRFDVQ